MEAVKFQEHITNRFREMDRPLEISHNTITTHVGKVPSYPPFLQANFPGIKYAFAHGSNIYPIELLGHSTSYVPNSKSRMLDLLLVLPDRKLAPTEKNIVGTEPEWDVFEPVTRTAAQFHGANHRRFPHHYPRKIRNMDFMEMAKLQRKPDCPVLYLPLLQVPRAGNQSRDLWCKYGVVSESDLIKDLTKWEPFHLAGRLHKAFLSFDPSREACHLPPDSLGHAMAINRIRAVQTALLLLPEKFTFGTLLHTVMSLSYRGDIRFPLAEDQQKVTKILHSQALQLSDIYLNLLLQTPGFIYPHLEHAAKKSAATTPGAVASNPGSAPKKESKENKINVESTTEMFAGYTVLTVTQLPTVLGGGGQIASDVLHHLAECHRKLATNARDRLTESGTGINPDRIDPISNEMRDLKTQLLSEKFVFHQDKSDNVRDQLFATLPHSLRQIAGAKSSSMRFWRLFSPLSLLSTSRLESTLGRPLPSDQIAIEEALKKLNRTTSVACARKALNTCGILTCSRYTLEKIAKKVRKV